MKKEHLGLMVQSIALDDEGVKSPINEGVNEGVIEFRGAPKNGGYFAIKLG